jgi:uncharacterized membrane protein YoaT (DUF817 family)
MAVSSPTSGRAEVETQTRRVMLPVSTFWWPPHRLDENTRGRSGDFHNLIFATIGFHVWVLWRSDVHVRRFGKVFELCTLSCTSARVYFDDFTNFFLVDSRGFLKVKGESVSRLYLDTLRSLSVISCYRTLCLLVLMTFLCVVSLMLCMMY